MFYDHNVSIPTGYPTYRSLVSYEADLRLLRIRPASFGTWDPSARTWTLVGPLDTGAPLGTPGPDGIPGTADDAHPLEPWGAIHLFILPFLPSADMLPPGGSVAFAVDAASAAGNGMPARLRWEEEPLG